MDKLDYLGSLLIADEQEGTKVLIMLNERQNCPGMAIYTCNPSIQRLMQEDCKLGTSLGCIMRPCLKQKTKTIGVEDRVMITRGYGKAA
jgi:hypothetical protein